jgi:hypothetical protein
MIPIVSAFTRLVLVAVIVTMLASALFSTGQVKDPSRLAEKLCADADPVSRCLWDRFSAESQRTLKSPESAPGRLEPVLNEGLNRILKGPSLFEPERFAGVRLSKESRLRLTQSLEGEELVRLNRRLMEDAYPHEIGVNPLRARQAAGAMLGVLLSMMAALGFGVWQTLPLWRGEAAGFYWTPWLKRVLPLTLGMGSTTFMFTIDMLAVQRFLPESGIYGAAGMIGRALVFLVAPLTMVMFPKIVRAAAKAERTDVLMQALGATALMAGCAAVFCTFWPDLPIRIVQGEKYLAAAPLVRWFAWCIIPLMVSTVLVNNLMARERYAAVPWLGAVAALYAFALWQPACHASPVRVIQTLGSFALIYFGVCLFFTWKQKRVGSPDPLPAGAP